MGMYTEIFVNADLREDTPQEVLDVLKAICGRDFRSAALEGKPDRWGLLFNNGSHCTPCTQCAALTFDDISEQWSIIGKGDIKNYEREIEQFFEWLMPWIDAQDGEFVGYWRYEEDLLPTIVVKTSAKPEPAADEKKRLVEAIAKADRELEPLREALHEARVAFQEYLSGPWQKAWIELREYEEKEPR